MRNKIIIIALAVFSFSIVFESCASSGASYNRISAKKSKILGLKYHLRNVAGVRLIGSKIVIGTAQQDFQRGFQGALIVVDGDIMGRNYKSVARIIPNGTIKSIKILSNAKTARYGSKAFEGVIVITTTDEAAR